MMDYQPSDDAGRREQKQNRIGAFNDANSAFARAMHGNRPFFADEIFKQLAELRKILRLEALEYADEEGRGGAEYWRNAKKNADDILARIDRICDAIRSRIARMTVVD